jgi:threonine/homoserine/homoserine lactone efflux protein
MRELMGPLVLFAAVMCLTPGPNVIMVTASAANFGVRRAIPHMLGITFGFGFLVTAVGLGLAGLIHAAPRLHTAVPVDQPQGLGHSARRTGGLHHRGRRYAMGTLVIAGVLAAACLASVAIWAGFGTMIGRFLRNPRARMAFNGSMAGLLVLSLIPVFW